MYLDTLFAVWFTWVKHEKGSLGISVVFGVGAAAPTLKTTANPEESRKR